MSIRYHFDQSFPVGLGWLGEEKAFCVVVAKQQYIFFFPRSFWPKISFREQPTKPSIRKQVKETRLFIIKTRLKILPVLTRDLQLGG
jgi:hypothetical protein